MSALADRTILALRANHDLLSSMVLAFDDNDLDRMSGSIDWDVAQVLSHLGSQAEISLANLENALAGLDAQDQDFNHSVWDRWNAMTQRQKVEGFLLESERFISAYEDLDEGSRSSLRMKLSWLPFPADIDLLTGLRLNEVAMHSWDVRVAFDPEATIPVAEADVLLDQMTGPIGFLIGFLGKSAGLDGSRAALRIETTDPGRVLGLVVGDAVELGVAPHEIDGILRIPAEALLRLIDGRLPSEHSPASVVLDSESVTLDQLRRVFPGF